jgi:hypothetical protein
MQRLCAAALLLILAAPMAFADDAAFAKSLAAARLDESFDPYCDDALHDPNSVVCRAIRAGAPAEAAVFEIARQFKVSHESAAAIGTAAVALLRNSEEKLPPDVYEREHARLVAALKREQNQTPILAAMAQLNIRGDASRYSALLPRIHAQPDPALAAIEVAWAIDQADGPLLVLGDAHVRAPENAEVIDAIGSVSYGYLRAVFGPIALTPRGAELRKRQRPISAETLTERASMQLRSLAELGLADAVVAGFEALPADVQQRIIDTPATYADLRLDFAAAAIVAGKPEVARRFNAAFTPLAEEDHDDDLGMRNLIAAALSGKKEGFFDILTEVLSGMSSTGTAVREQLLASMLEQHAYPAFAAEILRESKWARIASDKVPAELASSVQDLRARVDTLDATENARIALLASDAKQTVAQSAQLATPRLVPFTERPLPAASLASEATIIDCSDAAKVAASTNLPPFIHPIRMERNGDELAAVAISSAVDPAGEVALGGYWILRSRDGGRTWSEYYTGLRQNMPYVVVPASRLSLMDGDRLQIEVEVQELDTSSITFPPIGLRLTRTQKNLYLDMPWAELTRDSDGDGLTDLLEERIVTDPHDADTDGDAMPDAEDGLPQVAFAGGAGVEAEILAAALDDFSLGGGRIVVGIPEAETASCMIGTSAISQGVLFLVGNRASFAPLTMAGRAVVLTKDELTAYTKKFGPIYPAEVQHFVIEHGGMRAILDLNQSWSGITYLLTKTKDGWTKRALTSWIS